MTEIRYRPLSIRPRLRKDVGEMGWVTIKNGWITPCPVENAIGLFTAAEVNTAGDSIILMNGQAIRFRRKQVVPQFDGAYIE